MAVVSVVEKLDSPTMTATSKGDRNYTRTFDVYCSSRQDGPIVVQNAPLLPRLADSYAFGGESDAGSTVVSITPIRAEYIKGADGAEQCRWEVTVQYKVETVDEGETIENPLLRPVEIRGGTSLTTREVSKDKDGTVIKNSAKEPLPPIEITGGMFAVEFVRNEGSSPASSAVQYTNTVNSAAIWGGDIGTWKCESISYEKLQEGLYIYWRTSYKFVYNSDKHYIKLIDNGYNELSSGTLKPILLSDGTKPTEPFKLNGSGAKLSDSADPVLLADIKVYTERAFGSLGLPSSI